MAEAVEEEREEDGGTPKGLGVLDAPRDPLPLETLRPSEPEKKELLVGEGEVIKKVNEVKCHRCMH